MAENEDFTYLMNNQNTVDYSLITPERTAKLELLNHLVSNSSRAIALCGPKGIGKTTLLLNAFQQWRNTSWHCCLLQGGADLTLEHIEAQILATQSQVQSITHFFDLLAEQQRKMLLLIDDAGLLAPYFINTLLEYAVQHSVVKVVVVLTHDELAIKTCSDNALEDCHIIEIPPLSAAQCGDFLQHLALKSVLHIPLHDITDSMIANVYQQTHGIPANIIAQLPVLIQPPKANNINWRLLIFIVLGLLMAWGALKILPNLAPLSSMLKSLHP